MTDRCDLRCRYCIPEEAPTWLPREALLSFEEMTRLVRVAVSLGVRKVRITGGEPLLRRDVPKLVRMLRAIEGLDDLALTTNGTRLTKYAAALAEAGLSRVNVSLDSLQEDTFFAMTRRKALGEVLQGIEAALREGLGPVHLNCVVMRGVNDREVIDFASFARERGVTVRFIEFMPLEHGTEWGPDVWVSGAEIHARIHERFPLLPTPRDDPHAPSRDWRFADGSAGAVGFINSVSEPFCAQCNRIRVTADGKLRTCLFSQREHDLRRVLRAPANDGSGQGSDDELRACLVGAVRTKEKKHHITDGLFVKPGRSMSQIGG